MNNKYVKPALILLFLFYLINGIFYLQAQSITSDEGSFFNYATRFLKRQPDRVFPRSDNSKMPVNVINTIPRVVEQYLHPGLHKNDWGVSDIVYGRYVTLLVSLVTILLVFLWAKELYGDKAGLFAAFLLSFCPNSLANAALVTTDSYSCLFLLADMYLLWKFCKSSRQKYWVLFSFAVAFSQLVKQSLFHLYVIIPVFLLIYYLVIRPALEWKKLIAYTLIFLFINWFVINAGYYFHGSNMALGNYHFMSKLFQLVQDIFPVGFIVPFPKPFVDGLDMAKYYDQLGGGFYNLSSFGKVTILGKETTGGSFWYYYFVSLLFKMPVTYLVLIGVSVIALIKTSSIKSFIKNEFFLLFPVLYFLILMSFMYKTQCGIRQIIFIFPFLYILSSSLVKYCNSNLKKVLVAASAVYLVASVLMYWRNYYPYTNELILDKKMAYSYVGASNVEFLQDKYFFQSYLEKHKNVRFVTSTPQQGIFLINVADYLDIFNKHEHDWISNIKPFGQVAYSGLLINVTAGDLKTEQSK